MARSAPPLSPARDRREPLIRRGVRRSHADAGDAAESGLLGDVSEQRAAGQRCARTTGAVFTGARRQQRSQRPVRADLDAAREA